MFPGPNFNFVEEHAAEHADRAPVNPAVCSDVFLALLRHDRHARHSHDYRRWVVRWTSGHGVEGTIRRGLQHAGRERRLVLAFRGRRVDLSFPLLYLISRHH